MNKASRRPYAPICHWPPELGDLGLQHVDHFWHRGVHVPAVRVSRLYGVAMLQKLLRHETSNHLSVRARHLYASLVLKPQEATFLPELERSLDRGIRGMPSVLGGPAGALENVCGAHRPGFGRELFGLLGWLRDPGDDISGGYRIQESWRHGVQALCFLAGATHSKHADTLASEVVEHLMSSSLRFAHEDVLAAVERAARCLEAEENGMFTGQCPGSWKALATSGSVV